MLHQAELDYMIKVLQNMNLQALQLNTENVLQQRSDFGLRKILGAESLYEQAVRTLTDTMRPNVIYKMTDEFHCNYLYLQLPETQQGFLLIGPYLSAPLNQDFLLEKAEEYLVSAHRFPQMEQCLNSVPLLPDDSALYALLSAFGETIWGKGSAFQFLDLNMRVPEISLENMDDNIQDPASLALQMQTMERRYAYENELIDLVSQGLSNRAERMVRHFTSGAFDKRNPDPIRNLKNYCIVCNTLLRKAAEKGGVHPIQLDKYSSALGKKAERISQPEEGLELMREMVRTYCRLVRSHAISHYPPLIQKTLTYIDGNLSGHLTLHVLAAMHNVSSSYLSTLFHREYGKTITEYITERRMETAAGMLLTTHLQIQTIAQHCGFSDVNYFSKTFKRHYGTTPRQYREQRPTPLNN